jgi:hypothetical protein
VSSDRNWQPAAVTATSGTWGSLNLLSKPILSPDTGVSGLGAISCQPTVCVAVGSASNDYGPNQQDYPIAVTWSSGTWSSMGLEDVDPAGAGQRDGSFPTSVACTSAAQCLTIGRAGVYTPSGGPFGVYDFSAVITPVRPVIAPAPPAAVETVPTLSGARVSISPPDDDGGSPITSFTATAAPGSQSCTSAFHECDIPGLVNGRRYVVTASVSNGFASSPPVVSIPFVVGAVPTVPTHLRAALVGDTASISWRASGSPAGEPVLRYIVQAQDDRGGRRECATRVDSCPIGGLVKGRKYIVSVSAVDASGASPLARIQFIAR